MIVNEETEGLLELQKRRQQRKMKNGYGTRKQEI